MIQNIYNYNHISEQISTAGMPTREQFYEIAQAGFIAVIDLSLNESTDHLADEAELVQSLGMEYIHIPVIWESPQLADLEAFFQTMKRITPRKVFIHCVANYRASVFTYLFRTLQRLEEPNSAEEDMLRIWEPDEIWSDFIRQAQKTYSLNTE